MEQASIKLGTKNSARVGNVLNPGVKNVTKAGICCFLCYRCQARKRTVRVLEKNGYFSDEYCRVNRTLHNVDF